MASSSEKSVNLPEKSSFSQTCSLLSQYLKEGGSFGDHSLGISSSFGDLSLGISSNIEANGVPEIPRRPAATTMNLFPVGDNSGQDVSARNMAAPRNWESMNLFPHQAGFAPKNDTRNMIDSSLNKPAPQNAQMTIFYGGQVIVFNDFPADKANEIMQLASNRSSLSHGATYPPMQLPAQSYNSFAAGLPKSPVESTPPVSPGPPKIPTEPSCSVPPQSNSIPNFGNNLIPERPQPPSRTCDLPIARRNSLHRFLEKRKDRIVARAPYQVNGSAGGPDKPADSKPWLGLAAQTSQ